MASTREIKNRIKSVGDTQKITNAMYLISSTKMRKARREAEGTKPYFDLLRKEIRRMFALDEELQGIESRLYDSDVDESIAEGNNGILVITADKGLAGSYNQSVVRETEALIARRGDYKLYVVGDYGWRYFRSHGFNVEESFAHSMNEPSLAMARNITEEIFNDFEKGIIDRLYVSYTEYKGGMSAGVAMSDRLIPFDRDDFVPEGDEEASDKDASAAFEYEPDALTVLETILHSYLVGYIYSALVNSYSSEQSARMMAMDAANDNASELLGTLELEYNHLRQNAITQEITEVSSGARSLRKKRK